MNDDEWYDPALAIEAARPYLQQCGPCDHGLPMGCNCPEGDPRAVVSRLASVVERLSARTDFATCPHDVRHANTGRCTRCGQNGGTS